MKRSTKQQEFTKCVGMLIAYAYFKGYAFTFGDAFRDRRAFGEFGQKKLYSASKSTHKIRLAVDLNLFVNGEYIRNGKHPVYIELGEYWESLNVNAKWGGRFNDANHFSFQHWGVK